jgi:peptidoglycan glycosyltransferase
MRQGVAIFAAAALVAGTLPFLRDQDQKILALFQEAKIAVTGDDASKKAAADNGVDPPALTDISLAHMDDRRDMVTAPAHGQRTAELTLDPVFQRAAESILRRGNVYEGAIVMTDVRTGKVLVWASYNRGRPRDLVVEATAPSASVFKIVTAAALVEAGVPLNQRFCYPGGGEKGITERMLEPNEKRDKWCNTLGMAMGRSINVIFARLAKQHLDQDKLANVAGRLGFGLDIPFDVPVQPSKIDFPEDELEFVQSAAGFWHTYLSPFQAANLAQTVANGGEMIRNHIVARVVDEEGNEIYKAPTERKVFKRVLDERTAWSVARMMEQTVRNGTSFKTFHDRAGRPFLPDIAIAGKTGTLAKKNPETLITWWVGFAPADKPEIAVSVLVLNRGPWHIKGTHAASDMLRVYFADQGRKGVHYPPGFKGKKRRKENLKKKSESKSQSEKEAKK